MRPRVVQADLPEDLFKEYSSREELSIDCEMMGLNPNRDRLCLVQIMSEEGPTVLIQIDENNRPPLLKTLMENPEITKIFHFARIDCLFLKVRLGIEVANIFCTKLASRFGRTYTDRHGLKELVKEFYSENLDKSSQSSDWGKANLSNDQINYAQGDVRFLFGLKRILKEMMIRENRFHLYQASIDYLPTRIEMDRLGFAAEILEH